MQFLTTMRHDGDERPCLCKPASSGEPGLRRPDAMAVQTQRGGVELVDQLAPEWGKLCDESANNEPFYRPEWTLAYLRAFQRNGQFMLFTARRGNRLEAVLPIIEQDVTFCGFPVRKLRGTANSHFGRFDLVRAAEQEGETAVRAIWRALRDVPGWDLIELPDVPDSGAANLLLDSARGDGFLTDRWQSMLSPYIPLAGVSDAALVPHSAHFRQNLRRRLRKAQATWTVNLTRYEEPEPAALQQFYDIERSGWKGKSGTAIACSARTRGFYDEIARAAARGGYFSLYLLRYDDKVVAGQYGLTYANRYYSHKVAYDAAYATYGPGHLIIHAVLQDCIDRRLDEFDHLGSWTEANGEWAHATRRHAHCYIFRPTAFGRTLHWARFTAMKNLKKVSGLAAVAEFCQALHQSAARNWSHRD